MNYLFSALVDDFSDVTPVAHRLTDHETPASKRPGNFCGLRLISRMTRCFNDTQLHSMTYLFALGQK